MPDSPDLQPPPSRLVARLRALAGTRHALPAMCLLSFTDSFGFVIPPEVLWIPMALARPERLRSYAVWCTLSSVLGAMFGYLLGALAWEAGLDQFFYTWVPGYSPEQFQRVSSLYGEWNFLIVFIGGFTPLPFKVFTVAAGVCHERVDLLEFTAAALVSRALRFWLEAWLIHRYGQGLLRLFEQRLWIALALTLGFFALMIWLTSVWL